MSHPMTNVGAVLKEIVAGKSVQTLERQAADGELGILKVSAVTWGEFRAYENKAMPANYDPGDCPRPMDGDLLISRANTRELVGAPVMVHGNHPNLLLSDKLLKLVPKDEVVDRRFLLRALRSTEAKSHFFKRAGGSSGSMTNITQDDIRSAPIPLPPIPEQRRLAAILEKADLLRAKRREALAQLDRLARSMFVEMFGDPGANQKRWPLVALGELIREKPNNGIFRKNEEYGHGLPVAWVEELFRGYSVDLSASRRLPASQEEVRKFGLKDGDILFCRSSLKLAGLGYNNVYLGPDNAALFECHVIRISPRLDLVDSEFLNFLLRIPSQRQRIFRFAKTVTMSTIDQEGIKNVEVPVPPLTLQKDFVKRLHTIQRNAAQMSHSMGPLESLFESLQQRAFSGTL